ncbi:MAG: hypothetical protein GY859_38075, partial [Desulfobacterales bacterium]|nr:hypothetical protein [Desulfobacterales bacterium]
GGGDPFKRPDLVDLGGFVCPVKYLSFFSDANVAAYLAKRFPKKFGLLPDKKRIEEASRVIRKMGSLRCRPMLLSYIDELMASPLAGDDEGEFRVYDALVQSWLRRERTKIDVDPGRLLDACIILAAIMNMRRIRSIEDADLDELIARISEVRPIKKIDIKGRSLINRNSDGDWRFSHFSIQEFCVARLILGEKIFKPGKRIHVTDLILGWMRELGKTPNYPELLDFTDARMEGADFKGFC